MNIARYIDHTNLKATAKTEDIIKLCDEAKKYEFAAVCVNSCWVSKCKELLEGSSVNIASVVGFPLGAMVTSAKVFEASEAIKLGAREIDMVMNIGKFLDKKYSYVKEDIMKVAKVCKDSVLKVIIECSYLTDNEIIKASQIAVEAGADFVKTSTGFASSGAKISDLILMRKAVGDNVGIKAAGGIKTYKDALAMIEAGATRIGASSGVKIVNGANE